MQEDANGLKITISSEAGPYKDPKDVVLKAAYENVGDEPFSLTFWWTVTLRIKNEAGVTVKPGRGPELPCGVKEDPEALRPGDTFTRDRYLECTQPAGHERPIGWGYDLTPGTYEITLIMNSPPKHGYGINHDADAWKGRAESNSVKITIE